MYRNSVQERGIHIMTRVLETKVYAVWNEKGGVGKSTATVNLAAIFSQKGRRVLVVDYDPQNNVTPFFAQANENRKTVLDVIAHPEKVKSCIYRSKYQNIDIIKGNSKLRDEGCCPGSLHAALELVKERYDTIFIDCRTSHENLTYSALLAADVILTPVILDGYCRDNLAHVKETIDDIRYLYPKTQWYLFANRVENRKTQKEIFLDMIQRHDYPFLETCIVKRAAVESALKIRKPLIRHALRNQATQDFCDLAEELLDKERQGC